VSTAHLAIEGGTPVRAKPFPPWPYFANDEIDAVVRVLNSTRVNYHTGPEGRTFESEFAAFTGSRHAVALANGTVALELAFLCLDIGPGDEVIVPPRTFIATASAVVARGATPVFADVDPNSQNITANSIEAALTPQTRAIIPVHLAGMPCDMEPIMELAGRHDLKVIEDCAQALGARYRGAHVGTFGHVAAFSFCQDKIMTTCGEGGMLVTNDDELYERAWSYKDHGKSRALVYDTAPRTGVAFRWLHESFGTNWRMTEMQSAQGRIALAKIPDWVERRRANAGVLLQGLASHPALRIPVPGDEIYHAYYKFYAFVRPEMLAEGWTRDRIAEAVIAEGVPCFSGSCSEIYLEKAFAAADLAPITRLPVARELGETSLVLLVHPTAGEREMNDAVNAVEKVLAEAVLR
jgi:hypothetical protein